MVPESPSGVLAPDRASDPTPDRAADPASDRAADDRQRTGHVIVAGLHGVGLRTIEALVLSGRVVVVVDDHPDPRLTGPLHALGVALQSGDPRSPEVLAACGIAGASAVVCVQADDLRTMETALVARELRPDIRLVVSLANPEVGRALASVIGAGSVLDPAALAAPSVIEACVSRTRHTFDVGGEPFVLARVPVARPGTMRELFGALAPVAVARAAGGELLVCPSRDVAVVPADRVTVVGPAADVLAVTDPPDLTAPKLPRLRGARFYGGPDTEDVTGPRRAAPVPVARPLRGARFHGGASDDVPGGTGLGPPAVPEPGPEVPAELPYVEQRSSLRPIAALYEAVRDLERSLKIALALLGAAIVISTVILRFGYRAGGSPIGWVDALYFTVVTDATVGYGDFSFRGQPRWLEVYGIVDILSGAALATTVFALVTNSLVSRRLAQALGRQRVTGLRGHVIVFGLGAIGLRVVEGLLAAGREVVVVDRDEDNRYLTQVRSLGVPVVVGDSTLRETGALVNLAGASAVAVLTSSDLTNIETGLVLRESLGPRWTTVPVVLRVFDRPLAQTVGRNFDFRHMRSTAALAAPWFVGAALGLEVLDTFYVEAQPFLLARLRTADHPGLIGTAMHELSAQIRVLALRHDGVLDHPPRRDTRFVAGDEAFLVGPYEELLQLLDHDRRAPAGA